MGKTDGFASYPSLRDRVIIVTGGATGIGEALVEAFAMQNAHVAFLDVQDEAAEQLTKDGFVGGGRPQRGNDFGAAQAVACEARP